MKNDLSQERVLEEFDYDAENGWLIRKKDQYGRPYNKPCGHKPNHSDGYSSLRIDGKMYLTHRVIWLWCTGEWPDGEIDHIDRDPMNNRIENLRPATRSENNHNRGMNRNNSSGYPGVYYYKRYGKYKAQINGIHLGYFNTAEEAFEAYKLAKIKYHPTSPDALQYGYELMMCA